MNIYPNHAFKQMLDNGTYRVIKNKYPFTNSVPSVKSTQYAQDPSSAEVPYWAPGAAREAETAPQVPSPPEGSRESASSPEALSLSLLPIMALLAQLASGAAEQLQTDGNPAPFSTQAEIQPQVEAAPPAHLTAEAAGPAETPAPAQSTAEAPAQPPEEATVPVPPPAETVPAQPPMQAAPPSADDNYSISEIGSIEMNILDFIDLGVHEPPAEGASNSPPFINFIVFNRLGLSSKNLENLLHSTEDFELNIIDCNSKDNSWDYILSLNDSRIKSKTRFKKNMGPIYAVNYALSKRKPNQYFITVDSDTLILTPNWISKFMEVFEAFPEVGLLGVMRDNPYPRYLPPITPRNNGSTSYLQLKNADIHANMDFVPGHLQCLRPELIEKIGYWSEENGFGDAEISPRIVHYTDYTVGFLTTIEIDMTQKIGCNECKARGLCSLSRSVSDCFSLCKKLNKNASFVELNKWKFDATAVELAEGKRDAYCASIHDHESIMSHVYHADWANDNFNYYLQNSN